MKNGSSWAADRWLTGNRSRTQSAFPFGGFDFHLGLEVFEVAFVVAVTIVSLVFVLSVLYFTYIKRRGYFQDDPAYRYRQHCKRYHAVSAYGHPVKSIPSPTHKFLLTKLPRPSTIYLGVCPWLTSCDAGNGAGVSTKVLKRNGHNGPGPTSVHPLNSPPICHSSLLNVANQSPGEDSVYLTVRSEYSTPAGETPLEGRFFNDELPGIFHPTRARLMSERSTLPVDLGHMGPAGTSMGSQRKRRSDLNGNSGGGSGGEKMAPPTTLPLTSGPLTGEKKQSRRGSRAAPGHVKEQNRLASLNPLRKSHRHHHHEGASRRSGLASGEVLNGNRIVVAPPIMLMTKTDSRPSAVSPRC